MSFPFALTFFCPSDGVTTLSCEPWSIQVTPWNVAGRTPLPLGRGVVGKPGTKQTPGPLGCSAWELQPGPKTKYWFQQSFVICVNLEKRLRSSQPLRKRKSSTKSSLQTRCNSFLHGAWVIWFRDHQYWSIIKLKALSFQLGAGAS